MNYSKILIIIHVIGASSQNGHNGHMEDEWDSNEDNNSIISDDGSIDSQYPLDEMEGMICNVVITFFPYHSL